MTASKEPVASTAALALGSGERTQRLAIILAAILVCITMGRIVFNDLVWDDPFLIEGFDRSLAPRSPIETVTSSFWDNSSHYGQRLTDFWRPLTSLVLWGGGVIFGRWTPGYHLLSLLASIGASLSLLFLFRRLYPEREPHAIGAWLTLVFAAHPLNAEIIGMVANISDHLVLLFLLLQVGLLVDIGKGTGGRASLLIVALGGLLACCSKELGVLSALSPLAAFLLLEGTHGSGVRLLRIPMVWAASVLPVLLYLVGRTAVMASTGREHSFLGDSAFTPEVVFLGWGLAIKAALIPTPAGAHSFVGPDDVVTWVVAALAWAGLAAVTAWTLLGRRTTSLAIVGLLLALAMLVPSLLAVKIAEGELRFPTRYFHLPVAGLLIAAFPLVLRAWQRVSRLVLPGMVILLCLLSWIRIAEWNDNISFFGAESGYHPLSVTTRLNLAQAQCRAGLFDDAEDTIEALATMPGSTDPTAVALAENARAKIALLRDGDIERASFHMRLALSAQPDNLSNVLALAELRQRANRIDQALLVLRKARDARWFDAREKRQIEHTIRSFQSIGEKPEGAANP